VEFFMSFTLTPRRKRAVVVSVSVTLLGLVATPALAGVTNLFDSPVPAGFRVASGPNTVIPPYVIPSHTDVTIQSLLTTGDAPVNGYGFGGIPDALSTFKLNNTYTSLFVNHELTSAQGIARATGQRGSYVSRWVMDDKGKFISGSDLIKSSKFWDGSTWTDAPTGSDVATFSRFCAGSLADPLSLFDVATATGTPAGVYFANEESGDNGRVMGVDINSGIAYELPALGRASFEIVNLAKGTGKKTVTIADEDGTVNAGQLWVYEGTKKRSGNTVEKAGLTGGSLSIVKVVDDNGNRIVNDDAFRANTSLGQSRNFELASVSASKDGVAANTAALAAGTGLSRIEDGMFDPNNPNDYWFITTAGGSNNTANLSSGALWRLRFTDIANPSLGGKITMMLNSTSLPRTMSVAANGTVTAGTGLAMNMPDNLVVDAKGNILIQEDPGNNAVVSRIFAYRISDGAFAEIAHFDENRFTPGKSMFITQDEESSGIIEAPALGANTYLFDAQVHSAKELLAGTGAGTAAEYVEGGQLLRLTVKNWTNVYGS
jgi:hypothetical protein